MADKEQVIQALRATLISVKGALTLKQCNRDYRELQGEWIPYKRLGYPTLEKLFQDVPGFQLKEINKEWYVDAIASQETKHIALMVSRQKTSKKPAMKLSHPSRFPKKQGSWRKPLPASNYTSNYNNQYSSQLYRAKLNTTHNNNNNNNNNNYGSKPAKVVKQNESKNHISKQTLSKTNDSGEKTTAAKNFHPATHGRDTGLSEEFKHNNRIVKETESKSSGKMSASQRLSNLRDRLNTVDRIPLQLPAHNEQIVETKQVPDSKDAVSHVTPARNLEPPPESTSPVVKLEWTCKKLGLPQPVFIVSDLKIQGGPVTYHSTVKVGDTYSVCSYPASSPSKEVAMETASLKLLEKIESLNGGGLSTSSNTKAVAGVVEIVSEHKAGLWANNVPNLYREKYNENLPNNWLELVENCPKLIKDPLVNGYVLLLNNKEGPGLFNETVYGEETVERDLPPLQFPDDDFWNVFITVANSTLEVWVRIIGPQYSDSFELLLAEMAQFYERFGSTVDKSMITKDAWYAVNLDDGGWQRAKVLEIQDDTASVFLGDHGDDDIVYLNKIKILEPQFRKLAAQAILCRLEGAEELSASMVGGELAQRRLVGEVLVAAPGPRTDPSDPSIAIVLYDTSTHRDLNLNKEIVHDFCIAGAFAITQKWCEVEVGCVTDEGRVWVSCAAGAATVRNALALLTVGPYRRPLPAAPPAPPPLPHSLYIVRTLAGDWVRCTIISGLDGEGTVRTQLVDSGLILRAPLSSLVPLHTFSPALNAYPYQAMQVRLGEAERAAVSMVDRLRELLVGARVLCRALPAAPPGPPAPSAPHAPPAPHAELFVRTGPQRILLSVNNTILMEHDFLHNVKIKEEADETPNHVEALNKKKERIFRSCSSSGSLGVPSTGSSVVDERRSVLPGSALPAIGSYFDVHIAMAANPWNFVVQPINTKNTLQMMMSSLQEECPKLSESDAPTNPASGELYTVFYDKDGSWYRVTIAGTVSSEMVTVYFCDFGDLALLNSRSLRPMPKSVPLARSLPPQAIKARLYDVYPLHQDWTVEDCIRFQELCVDQQFVGVCKEVGKDPLNPTEPLLTLDLIDTSTVEDIYLNKQLVEEGRARLYSTSS